MKKLLIALAIIIVLTIHFYFMATDWLYRDCVSYFFDLLWLTLLFLVCLSFILIFIGGLIGIYLGVSYIFENGFNWNKIINGLLVSLVALSFSSLSVIALKEMIMHSHVDIHDIAEKCYHDNNGKCLPQDLSDNR